MTLWHHEAKRLFNIDRCMTARVTDLFVHEVPANVPFEIREIDGQERVYDVSRRREILLPMAVPEPPVVHDLVVGHEGGSGSATPTTMERKVVHDGLGTAAVERTGTLPVEKKTVHESGSVPAVTERTGTPVTEKEKAVGSVSRETHVPVSAGGLARALK